MTQKNPNRRKYVLVACGSGIATATLVSEAIKDAVTEAGLNVEVQRCGTREMVSRAPDVDLIVTTAKYKGEPIGKPIIGAMPVLTGIGADKWKADLIKMIKEIQ